MTKQKKRARSSKSAVSPRPARKPSARLSDLAEYDEHQWRDWWWNAISAYTRETDRQGGQNVFAPFVLLRLSPRPANEIAEALRRGLRGRVAIPARGLTLLLNDWQMLRDGWQGASLALGVGAQLGAPHLSECICALIEKRHALKLQDREELAAEMAAALLMRNRPAEALRAARAMRRQDLLSLHVAAQLIPHLAQGHAPRLELFVRDLAPELVHSDPDSAIVETFDLALGPPHKRPRTSELPPVSDRQHAELRAFIERMLTTPQAPPDTNEMLRSITGKLQDETSFHSFFANLGIRVN